MSWAITHHGDRIVAGTRWTDAACRIAGRNLTRAEWEGHIGDLAPYRATCPDHAVEG